MALITIFLLITTSLFLLSKVGMDLSIFSNWQLISQYVSLIGTVLLSLSFILGSRAKFLEKIFGGLDKVVKMHHIIGGIAFVLLLHHPLFLVFSVLPNFKLATQYVFLSSQLSYNPGVIALYLMLLLLFLTMVIRLPYQIWIKTHDFFGLVLFFASLHIFLITSDVSRYLPLRIWMFINLAIGLFFYIYKVFLYKWFSQSYKYRIERINQINNIVEIYLSPQGKSMSFVAGQFAFVKFEQSGFSESHPFSISCSPTDVGLRFSIKNLGDFTSQLTKLGVGTLATVTGPYGDFGREFFAKKNVVCIAGGIGVSPFVGMIGQEIVNPIGRKIKFFYLSKDLTNPIYGDFFAKANNTLTNFEYFYNEKNIFSHIDNVLEYLYFLCGPSSMMHSYEAQLRAKGVPASNIIFEEFNFK